MRRAATVILAALVAATPAGATASSKRLSSGHRAPAHNAKPKPKGPKRPESPKRPKKPKKPKPPVALTSRPRAVTGTSAGVLGRVNPNGQPTTSWFQYGRSARYGSQTPGRLVGSGRRSRTIGAALAKLAPMTTYHYRLVASHCRGCAGGTAYGADGTFTTDGFLNPVFRQSSIADPFVLTTQGPTGYWVYSTGERFPILHSPDLVHWTWAGSALPRKPAWVVQTGDWHPWAPHVVTLRRACPNTPSPICYVMFYTALSAAFNTNCVALATSSTPWGPFNDQGPLSNGVLDAAGRPIGCGDDAGYGMIDPSVFTDPATGIHYLYGSEDFACPQASSTCTDVNSVLQPTISVIPLSDDYLAATGTRTPLFTGDPGTWEAADVAAPTVEGPSVTVHNGTYYLLYSGGSWRSVYGMGYATAPSATGPFTKSPRNPIMAQTGTAFSPGGGDTVTTGPHGGSWLVYHARTSPTTERTLRLDAFSWQPAPPGPDLPVIAGPTSAPQPNLP